MRRAVLLILLAVSLGMSLVDEAAARGRRRRGCCVPCYCYPSYNWGCPSATSARGPTQPPTAVLNVNGRTHQIFATGERDETPDTPPPPTLLGKGDGETFAGTDRKAAKLSVGSGPTVTFSTVASLLDDLWPDAQMLDHDPPITKDPKSPRVAEEDRNVHVDAFLYAAKKETDNDFHLIIGDDPDSGSGRFLNVEVSGLPTAGPFKTTLTAARQQFRDLVQGNLPDATGYHRYQPPIPITVTGSNFYDVDHLPGTVGPSFAKPTTAWEIHPVTSIAPR